MRKYASPLFQHRHYAAIAKVLADNYDRSTNIGDLQHGKIMRALSDLFWRDNPNFDADRFFAASRGEPVNGKDKR